MRHLFFRSIGILLSLVGIFGFLNTTSAASGQSITLAPGWNTFSTPKVLDSITFQSGGTGLYFYTLTSTGWQNITPTTSTIKPLEGFMVNNTNITNSQVELTYKENLSPMEMIFQKSLHVGWNLLGITTITNPFGSIGGGSMIVDFTRTNGGGQNYVNKVANSFYATTGNNLSVFSLGESYGLFLQSALLYGSVQNQNTSSGYIPETVSVSLSGGIVTSGKAAQNILQVRVTAGDQDVTLSGFTLSRSGSTGFLSRLANVQLYRNGVSVGNINVSDDFITISGLSSYIIGANTTQVYEFKADTLVDFSNTSLSFFLDTSNIQITEVATNQDSNITVIGSSSIETQFAPINLTLTKNSTQSITVAPGTSNVVLFNTEIESSGSFDVTQFTLTPLGIDTPTTDLSESSNFNSLILTVNGVDYDLLFTTFNSGSTYVFNRTSDKFRIDAGVGVNVRLMANISNNSGTGTYSYKLSIDKLKSIFLGNEVTLSEKSIIGDSVNIANPELIVKTATVAAPSNSKIYSNASALEIGRFGLEAKIEEITVREITFTNGTSSSGVNDFTRLISGTNVKLINIADGSQISATATVNTNEIKLTGMSIKIAKDTTANFRIAVDTQGDLVTTFTDANNQLALVVSVVSATSNSTLSITTSPLQTMKTYTVNLIPPTVTLVKKNSNMFLITITNVDTDSNIILNSITAQVQLVANNNSSYTGITCLRDEGSTEKCDTVTSTGSIPGIAKEFLFSGGISIPKNSNIAREIYIDSNYITPTDLQGEITRLNYSNSGATVYFDEAYSVIAQ